MEDNKETLVEQESEDQKKIDLDSNFLKNEKTLDYNKVSFDEDGNIATYSVRMEDGDGNDIYILTDHRGYYIRPSSKDEFEGIIPNDENKEPNPLFNFKEPENKNKVSTKTNIEVKKETETETNEIKNQVLKSFIERENLNLSPKIANDLDNMFNSYYKKQVEAEKSNINALAKELEETKQKYNLEKQGYKIDDESWKDLLKVTDNDYTKFEKYAPKILSKTDVLGSSIKLQTTSQQQFKEAENTNKPLVRGETTLSSILDSGFKKYGGK